MQTFAKKGRAGRKIKHWRFYIKNRYCFPCNPAAILFAIYSYSFFLLFCVVFGRDELLLYHKATMKED
jgi:hypothetical protein